MLIVAARRIKAASRSIPDVFSPTCSHRQEEEEEEDQRKTRLKEKIRLFAVRGR